MVEKFPNATLSFYPSGKFNRIGITIPASSKSMPLGTKLRLRSAGPTGVVFEKVSPTEIGVTLRAAVRGQEQVLVTSVDGVAHGVIQGPAFGRTSTTATVEDNLVTFQIPANEHRAFYRSHLRGKKGGKVLLDPTPPLVVAAPVPAPPNGVVNGAGTVLIGFGGGTKTYQFDVPTEQLMELVLSLAPYRRS